VRRWTSRLTLVMLATLAVTASGVSSAHATCPDLDIVCRVDDAVGVGGGLPVDTIGPVDTPVDEVVRPVIGTVDQVVDVVIGTVDQVVDDVLGRVNELPGGGQVDPPGLGGGGGSHVGGTPPGDQGRGLNPAVPGHRDALARGPRLSDPTGSSAVDHPPTTRGTRPDRTSGDRSRAALGGVARSLAIVLALFGLAVAFVAVQDRLDRGDPRLALAPVESDVVEFA
jgi:hypothetical protein